MSIRQLTGRAVWMEVNLDAITHNVHLLRTLSKNPKAGIIAVVKANGMGLGAIMTSKHLKEIGVERLAVATTQEGKELRDANIPGPIHLLGNVQDYEMNACLQYDLIPTVVDKDAILGISKEAKSMNPDLKPKVNIKIDTGMSRNGCQPDEVNDLVQFCKECQVHLDGMFTHLACWDVPDFNDKQLDLFYKTIKPYRNTGIIFHASNSGGSMVGSGSDLDYIRPGIAIFGAPPSNDGEIMKKLGFKPTTAVRGTPTLVKHLTRGRKIGYDATHTCEEDSWIATFPMGYADGLWRSQSQSKGTVIRDKTGEKCPIVGRVSMDAVTVHVPECVSKDETFTFLSADYDPTIAIVPLSMTVGSIPHDVLTKFTPRLPRIYLQEGRNPVVAQLTS